MDFVEQARYAEAHGAGFDFRLGNILLDETTQKLHIIDVVDERNRIHHLCSEIMLIPFEEMAKFCPENSQAKTHFLRMKEKMEIAAREYSVPVTILEAIRKQHEHPVFRKGATHVGVYVSYKDSTDRLREVLDTLRKDVLSLSR
jgi:hypothetical protein